MPHVRAWPLLSVHAAVGAAHPAYWRPLHAAEHLSSPETGHARCCRGPRSVDRVPGAVAACEEVDKNTPQSEAIKSREATRYISISQFGAAGWLDMRPDGLHHTKMVSAMFLTAIQRRHGLYLSVIAPTLLVEKAAAGVHVTVGEYKGDSLANSPTRATAPPSTMGC